MREVGTICSYNLYQNFTNILWLTLHTTFILQNFSLKLGQCVPMAWNINIIIPVILIFIIRNMQKLINYANYELISVFIFSLLKIVWFCNVEFNIIHYIVKPVVLTCRGSKLQNDTKFGGVNNFSVLFLNSEKLI